MSDQPLEQPSDNQVYLFELLDQLTLHPNPSKDARMKEILANLDQEKVDLLFQHRNSVGFLISLGKEKIDDLSEEEAAMCVFINKKPKHVRSDKERAMDLAKENGIHTRLAEGIIANRRRTKRVATEDGHTETQKQRIKRITGEGMKYSDTE